MSLNFIGFIRLIIILVNRLFKDHLRNRLLSLLLADRNNPVVGVERTVFGLRCFVG